MSQVSFISHRLYLIEILLLKNKIIDPETYFQMSDHLLHSLPGLSLSEDSHELDREISELNDLMEKLKEHISYLKKALNQ